MSLLTTFFLGGAVQCDEVEVSHKKTLNVLKIRSGIESKKLSIHDSLIRLVVQT